MQVSKSSKDQLLERACVALGLSHQNSCGRALTIEEATFISETMIELIEHTHPELKEDIQRN